MGSRSGSETTAALMVAFVRRSTWTQAALARHCEVSTRTIRRRLVDLQSAGMPLERDAEHPHVYWSVPKGWFPAAVALGEEEVRQAARLLARLPRNALQESLLLHLRGPGAFRPPDQPCADHDEGVLATLEDAASQRCVARVRYYSASRGELSTRLVSVHRLTYGEAPRYVATCHRSDELRWFRVDRSERVHLDANEPFRTHCAGSIAEFMEQSVRGFHGGDAVHSCPFFVRCPESRWVVGNLPRPFPVEFLEGGIAGAWIETTTPGRGAIATLVAPPSRGRGLKHGHSEVPVWTENVAPLAGAWIETCTARPRSGGHAPPSR